MKEYCFKADVTFPYKGANFIRDATYKFSIFQNERGNTYFMTTIRGKIITMHTDYFHQMFTEVECTPLMMFEEFYDTEINLNEENI